MDPVSAVLTIMIVFALLKRTPDWAQEAWDALRNGARSDAYRDQLRRLRKAGITPSRHGGLWRRITGNAWREATGRARSWAAGWAARDRAGQFARRLDDAAGRAAERIRNRRPNGGAGADGTSPRQGPVRGSATVDRPETLVVTASPTRSALPAGGGSTNGGRPTGPAPAPPSPASPGPYRTTATVYTAGGPFGPVRAIPAAAPGPLVATVTLPPAPAPVSPAAVPSLPAPPHPSALTAAAKGAATAAVLTGEVQERTTPTSTPALPAPPTPRAIEGAATVMGVEVTGVVSGAAACRRVSAAIQIANEAYQAGLAAARAEIASIIEQTLANVQFDGRGEVVAWLTTAAEAAAQASAAAATCGVEVHPALNRAAKAFDRRNS